MNRLPDRGTNAAATFLGNAGALITYMLNWQGRSMEIYEFCILPPRGPLW